MQEKLPYLELKTLMTKAEFIQGGQISLFNSKIHTLNNKMSSDKLVYRSVILQKNNLGLLPVPCLLPYPAFVDTGQRWYLSEKKVHSAPETQFYFRQCFGESGASVFR